MVRVWVDAIRQWVSIEANNASVQSVLLALSNQAGFTVAFPDGGELGRVTVAVKNIPLEEGIQRVLGSKPYTVSYAVGESGGKIVASVDLRPGLLDRVGSRQPASAMAAALAGTADSGWGVDQGRSGGSANAKDHAAELAAALDNLSLDTIKQLMSEAKDPAMRRSMLEALTERDNQSAVQPLFLESLQDSDADVREAALEHLLTSYEPIPLAPLADAAEQRYWNCRILNILEAIPKKYHPDATALLRALPYAETLAACNQFRDQCSHRYRAVAPQSVEQ